MSGGTVGEAPATPEPTLREEAERSRLHECLIASRIMLDQAGKVAIAARLNFEALRAYLDVRGFTPTEGELKRAAVRVTGGATAEAPPASRIMLPD